MEENSTNAIYWCQQQEPLQRLVYGISHDMGAPLRSVVRFAELLRQRLGERLDEKEQYWLTLLTEGGSQAQAMVDGLLQYSRLQTHQQEHSPFSLAQMLELVVTTQRRETGRSDADIICTGEWPTLTGNPHHWRVLLTALVNNALLYQPLPVADVALAEPRVLIDASVSAGELTLQIDDNGIGVSTSYLADISRPFMRAVNRQEYPGLGMGLSYCERIAQLSNGRLGFGHSPLGGLRVIYQVACDGN